MSTMDPRIRSVFSSVLGINADRLTDEDSPATIAEWDSLSHISLVMALEAEFGVQFEPEDLAGMASVAAIRERVGDDS